MVAADFPWVPAGRQFQRLSLGYGCDGRFGWGVWSSDSPSADEGSSAFRFTVDCRDLIRKLSLPGATNRRRMGWFWFGSTDSHFDGVGYSCRPGRSAYRSRFNQCVGFTFRVRAMARLCQRGTATWSRFRWRRDVVKGNCDSNIIR